MAFVTVPQQTFLTDVLKTWIQALQTAVTVEVTPKHPDINKELKLPVLVLNRVSDETMVLARNSGFFGYNKANETLESLERLEGYRYSSSFQLDIFARSHSEMLSLVSQVQAKLIDPYGDGFLAEGYPLQWQEIPLKHYASAASVGTATDLRIRYKYRDISGTQVEGFDNEILQYSMTIPFWCDYLKARGIDKILTASIAQG